MKTNIVKAVSQWSIAISMVLALAGCGGGGGSGGTTVTPTGTAVSMVAFKSVFLGISSARAYNFPSLVGSDNQGRSWSGSYELVANGTTVYESRNVSESQSLLKAQMTGGVQISTVTTRYFLADGSVYKILFSTGVSYVPTSQAVLPASAKVGDSGTFGVFTGSDGTVLTYKWALNAGSSGSSVLVISTIVTSGSTVTLSEIDNINLDANGKPTSVSAVTTGSGVTVTIAGNMTGSGA